MSGGVEPVRFISVNAGGPLELEGEIVEEALACISVNAMELATFMCSPRDLDLLAIGFLLNERLINGPADIASIHVSASNCVEIWLNSRFRPPERLIVTAGCGGGVTFDDFSERHPALVSELSATPGRLAELMKKMHQGATLYQRSRGIHTAALARQDEILLQVEDVGRHNCLDKLAGAAFMRQLETQDGILLSSGRISSEMINKARQMRTPIICSRTSPTSLSVALAEVWNMTIVAYLRQNRMRIYSHPERVLSDLETDLGPVADEQSGAAESGAAPASRG